MSTPSSVPTSTIDPNGPAANDSAGRSRRRLRPVPVDAEREALPLQRALAIQSRVEPEPGLVPKRRARPPAGPTAWLPPGSRPPARRLAAARASTRHRAWSTRPTRRRRVRSRPGAPNAAIETPTRSTSSGGTGGGGRRARPRSSQAALTADLSASRRPDLGGGRARLRSTIPCHAAWSRSRWDSGTVPLR